MSYLPNPQGRRSSGFAEVVQSFLSAPGLPFASILSSERIQQAFNVRLLREGTIYSHAVVLWAFLSQVLRDGKEASCQSAVARIVAHRQQQGLPTPTKTPAITAEPEHAYPSRP